MISKCKTFLICFLLGASFSQSAFALSPLTETLLRYQAHPQSHGYLVNYLNRERPRIYSTLLFDLVNIVQGHDHADPAPLLGYILSQPPPVEQRCLLVRGYTFTHIAAVYGDVALLRLLVSEDIGPDPAYSPLARSGVAEPGSAQGFASDFSTDSVYTRTTPLMEAIRARRIEAMQFLIGAGANLMATDMVDRSPFTFALETGDDALIQVFLSAYLNSDDRFRTLDLEQKNAFLRHAIPILINQFVVGSVELDQITRLLIEGNLGEASDLSPAVRAREILRHNPLAVSHGRPGLGFQKPSSSREND